MNRRQVLQFGLLLAAQAVLPALAAPSLTANVRLTREGEFFVAHVELVNQGAEAVDVLVSRGDRSGVQLSGRYGEAVLEPFYLDPERLSRAAPRSVWRPLPAQGKLSLGRFILSVVGEVTGDTATFTLQVSTPQGQVELEVKGVEPS